MGKKILLVWLASETVFFLSLLIFEHGPISSIAVVSRSIEWLLFLVCASLVRYEPIRKNKLIFLNFTVFFSVSALFYVYDFLDSQFARWYFNQYISFGAYYFFLTFALVYVSLDAILRDFKSVYKYALTMSIVGIFFVYYYQGVLENPNYLLSTSDAKTFKTINDARESYAKQNGGEPSVEVLAQISDLEMWEGGKPVGKLYSDEKLKVVTEFYPYLSGTNYIVLLWRPMYMNGIYMCVLGVGFILLFFGYQYMKDPPQGAYIDKIMFLFLVFCTLEIMHALSFVKSVEWQTFRELQNIGLAVSVFLLILIGLFFALRLRFIRSIKGEFYEHEILVSPGNITRWRDALDDLLVAHFFNRKAIIGRLFLHSSDEK